jgi:hypothetical protein
LIDAGIICLLATPAARILDLLWIYWRAGRRGLAGLCAVSLIVIAVSITVGVLYPNR